MFILELLGFVKARLVPEGPGGTEEDYLALMEERLDIREFVTMVNVISYIQTNLSQMPSMSASNPLP